MRGVADAALKECVRLHGGVARPELVGEPLEGVRDADAEGAEALAVALEGYFKRRCAANEVVNDGDFVRKANDMQMHATWSAYFERLAITNFLFPETAYELVGFSNIPIARDQSITFQPIASKQRFHFKYL